MAAESSHSSRESCRVAGCCSTAFLVSRDDAVKSAAALAEIARAIHEENSVLNVS